MDEAVEILVSYAAGTADMLGVCLASVRRHNAGMDYSVTVLAGDKQALEEVKWFAERYEAAYCYYDSTGATTSSGRHARMLDAAVRNVKAEYFLTLDSDCFPVADGWLVRLDELGKETDHVAIMGIAWPWVPPPPTVGRDTIEWRLRRQHCWNNTQVACQMMRTEYFLSRGLKFGDPEGDDTNFGLMDKVHAEGAVVAGLKPTRCALPDDKRFDPEINRHVCVVYGDIIYHHGGASRETHGEFRIDSGLFDVARRRVFEEKGAEWILLPGNSHVYRMDNEEKVAQAKMGMMYAQIPQFLEKNRSLFGGGWI